MQEERIVEQLDNMVAAGRVTSEEAARVRATAGTPEFHAALGAIRARQAQVHTDDGVAAGRLSREEADTALHGIRDGGHSAELRAHIRGTDRGSAG